MHAGVTIYTLVPGHSAMEQLLCLSPQPGQYSWWSGVVQCQYIHHHYKTAGVNKDSFKKATD